MGVSNCLKDMALQYFREINKAAPLPDDDLIYRADKLVEDVRRWFKARADFDPKEVD